MGYFKATIITQGTHKNIKLASPPHFYHSLRKLKEGQTVWVEVDERAPKRSEQQNRYLWLCYGLIAETTGYTSEEIHELCKKKFLTPKYAHVLGENLTMRSTTKLSKAEFVSYTEEIRRWAASELSVNIPDPEDSPRLINE